MKQNFLKIYLVFNALFLSVKQNIAKEHFEIKFVYSSKRHWKNEEEYSRYLYSLCYDFLNNERLGAGK